MNRETSELRVVAAFILGLSVGMCLMILYMTIRDPKPYLHTPPPAAATERN